MLDILAMEEQFTGEYKRAFSKISMYGTMTPIDSEKYEDRVLNIYDMLLSAQNDGKPVEKIIGKDLELFCREYYKNHDMGELLGVVAKRAFSVMTILLLFSIVRFCIAIADNGGVSFLTNFDNFIALDINAIPIIIGLGVGLVVICIEAIAKNKILLKTDKIKNGLYAVGGVIIFAICIAVALLLFGGMDVTMPLWLMMTISGGYCIAHALVVAAKRYKRNGTIKNLDKANRHELKAFQKEITLEYDIRTGAEAMAERFDKMKKKWVKKGKGKPEFEDFVAYMKKEQRLIKRADIFFIIIILGMAAVNIAVNIGSDELGIIVFASVVASAISFAISRFAMNAMKEVQEAQWIVLEECARKNIDIYEYVENMHDAMK